MSWWSRFIDDGAAEWHQRARVATRASEQEKGSGFNTHKLAQYYELYGKRGIDVLVVDEEILRSIPPGYVVISERVLLEMIGEERMAQLRAVCTFPVVKP